MGGWWALKRPEGQDRSVPTSKQNLKWGRGKVQNQERDPQNRQRSAARANEHIWGRRREKGMTLEARASR